MESLFFEKPNNSDNVRPAFETFKGNVCHVLKEKGDIDFVVEVLTSDDIKKMWNRCWYREAFYLLALTDYLSRINDLPLCKDFDEIRNKKLQEPVYPRDIFLSARLSNKLDRRNICMEESIPEFARFNIMESDIRNVC